MKTFLVGFLIGIVLLPAGFYWYLRSGNAPVATSAPPMPLEHFLVKTAIHATIDRHEIPIQITNVNQDSLVAGAQIYQQDCSVCHGLPGQPPTAIAKGMYPRPPQFFRANAKKMDDAASEVYWKIKNGIRLTGMPGFYASLNDGQIRNLSALLENAVSLPPAASAALKNAPAKASEAAPPASKHTRSPHKRT